MVPEQLTALPNVQVWLTGSHLYGLNTPDSDEDYGAIFYDPELIVDPFQEAVDTVPRKNGDYWGHTLSKLALLLAKGNPNIVDLIFHEPIIQSEVVTEFIEQVKPCVLHRQLVDSYIGYAQNQYERGFLYQKRQNDKRQAHIEELGYDPKYVSHLFRLIITAQHIMDFDEYYDLRDDDIVREYLLRVKRGEYSREKLLKDRETLMGALENMKAKKYEKLRDNESLKIVASDYFLRLFNL